MATIISNQASATYTFDGSNQILTTSSNIANTTLLDDYSIGITGGMAADNGEDNEETEGGDE